MVASHTSLWLMVYWFSFWFYILDIQKQPLLKEDGEMCDHDIDPRYAHSFKSAIWIKSYRVIIIGSQNRYVVDRDENPWRTFQMRIISQNNSCWLMFPWLMRYKSVWPTVSQHVISSKELNRNVQVLNRSWHCRVTIVDCRHVYAKKRYGIFNHLVWESFHYF